MAGPNKKSLEQIYQKKTQLEHILLRPDSYSEWGARRLWAHHAHKPVTHRAPAPAAVGSIQKSASQQWVLDDSGPDPKIVSKSITYVSASCRGRTARSKGSPPVSPPSAGARSVQDL